jgi:hypothetical protein
MDTHLGGYYERRIVAGDNIPNRRNHLIRGDYVDRRKENEMNTLDKFAPAMAAAQAKMPAVPMDGRNPYYKSRYATLGSVIETSRGILAEHGFSVIQQVISNDTGDAVGIRTMILHESGQSMSWDAVVKIPLDSNPGQAAGKLITYLRRYSLAAALNLYAEEDTDNNSPKQQAKPQPVKEKAQRNNEILTELGYQPMTLEQAAKVTNRDGVPYTEIEPERLSHMSRSIDTAIKANGHDQKQLAELQTKQAAIKAILGADNQGT